MTKQKDDPIGLTGRVHLTGGLADECPSLELAGRATTGDIKLWSHISHGKGNTGAQGQFRAAVFDGKKWRTFRLNIVSGDHARYDSFDDRRRKLSAVLETLSDLKGQMACLKQSTYGVTFTIKADVATTSAAHRSRPDATASLPLSGGEKRAEGSTKPVQLTLF